MSKIKITTIIKLACGGAITALTIAMCATPLAPLGICIAVCGAIAFGCEAIESIKSCFEHNDVVQPIDTHGVDSYATQSSYVNSKNESIAGSNEDSISIASTDTFYSVYSHDSAISLGSRDLSNTYIMGLTSHSLDGDSNT